jgi:hypothetical protein
LAPTGAGPEQHANKCTIQSPGMATEIDSCQGPDREVAMTSWRSSMEATTRIGYGALWGVFRGSFFSSGGLLSM